MDNLTYGKDTHRTLRCSTSERAWKGEELFQVRPKPDEGHVLNVDKSFPGGVSVMINYNKIQSSKPVKSQKMWLQPLIVRTSICPLFGETTFSSNILGHATLCRRYLGPVLLFGVGVHVREASQHQSFHQGPLHRTGQQVERRAAAGKLLGQVPPALALHNNVRPEQTKRRRVCERLGATSRGSVAEAVVQPKG